MGFLKRVSPCISPELLKALAKMGHGDEIVLADAHFPAHTMGKANGATVIRADGVGIPDLLNGILNLINLDEYVPCSVFVMAVAPQDAGLEPPVWATYKKILAVNNGNREPVVKAVERFAFYEQSKKAAVVVQTGETAKYGNIILKNGLVIPEPQERFWE